MLAVHAYLGDRDQGGRYCCLPLLRTDRYTYSNKGGQQHT
jgi:hypothetical protein